MRCDVNNKTQLDLIKEALCRGESLKMAFVHAINYVYNTHQWLSMYEEYDNCAKINKLLKDEFPNWKKTKNKVMSDPNLRNLYNNIIIT
jgi:hypothetical protein